VNSSEVAFKVATFKTIQDAFKKAGKFKFIEDEF